MTVGEKHPTYQICPQCGQQNRSSFHCCHHCGYVFPKASKKLRLPTARAGMIGGAALGLAFGLLLWDELTSFGITIFFLAGGLLGYGLCYGPKANVRNALTGFVVGAVPSILGIIVLGSSISPAQIALVLFSMPLGNAIVWRSMFIGTRAIRTGGVVGAIGGVIAAIVIVVTRSNDIGVGMALISIFDLACLGAIAGMGVVYNPWFVLILGIFGGFWSWFGWQFDPSPVIELPEYLILGLIDAAALSGFLHMLGN